MLKRLLNKLRGAQPKKESQLDMLKKRGLKVGSNFFMAPGCVLDPSHCWHISIGDNVALGPQVYILAHDSIMHRFIGYGNVANVKIGNDVTIGTRAIILPGVTIGNRVMIGAGAVVAHDIPNNSIAAGNPAKVVGLFNNYLEKHKDRLNKRPTFDESYLMENGVTQSQKDEMLNACEKHGSIYLK